MMRSIRTWGLVASFLGASLACDRVLAAGTSGSGSGGTTGWTPLTPSADSRLIYVSASGSDANTGLSATSPKLTIAAGMKLMRSGYPDWLMLKRGDIFHDSIDNIAASGRSTTEPSVITSYGTGDRPLLLTGASSGASFNAGQVVNNVAIVGLHFIAHKWRGSSAEYPSGVGVISPGDYLLIEDCMIENYANSILIQGFPTVRTGTKIRRNILIDPVRLDPNLGSTNIFIDEYDGVLVEENLMEHSDASEARGAFVSHNIYMHEDNPSANIVVRGNIATGGGRTNFNTRAGGLIDNNLSYRGAIGISVGVSYAQTYSSGTISNNVILNSRDNQNGQALGVGIYIAKSDGIAMNNNVITQNSGGTLPEAINIDSTTASASIVGNIIWRWLPLTQPSWGSETIHIDGMPSGTITIASNQVQQLGNALLVTTTVKSPPPRIIAYSNKYFSLRQNMWWFGVASISTSTSDWQQLFGDSGMTLTRQSYIDPDRTLASYNGSLGGDASVQGFIAEAHKQSRDNWRPQYTAAAVNDFIRAGFSIGTPACGGDVDHNGRVDASDGTLLNTMIQTGQWAADLNRDGVINSADYTVWLNAFRAACP
jgi:hypothetical protein